MSITLASNNVVVASCQGARSRHYGWAPIKIAIMESKDSAQSPNYFLSPDMLSITSIRLNGSNYAQWAQAVEVFLLGRKKFDYVIKELPIAIDHKFADWKAEDA